VKEAAMRKLISIAALLASGAALADESAVKLKEGRGKELVESNCIMCHSLDYVPMNSPFLDRKGWEATVTKMMKAMGAPITEQDAAAIVDYLAQNYGKKDQPK
jgi:mono/diheme cytochrome c family protein